MVLQQPHQLPMHACVHAKWLQSCLTLCKPMDCSLPGSSVHEILQARILEWVVIPSSRGSSRPRDQSHVSYVSCIGRWVLHHWCHLGSHMETQETQVRSLGREDPLEEGLETHSSILAWEIPGQRSLVGYSPWGREELDMTERLN